MDSIDVPRAISACDQEINAYPDEPRYRYQLSRAHHRAARVAEAHKSKASTEASDAVALANLDAAMAKGYPVAFNNMAYKLQRGEGIAKDERKAADLYLETLNRVLYCCWVPVARHILDEEKKHDRTAVRRIIDALTQWDAALGSQQARELLSELNSNGTLTPTDPLPPAKFTDLPPWFREAP
jgi:hypothetical protein